VLFRSVDIGGTAPILVDVEGATPSRLVVALGKNGKIYLLNRDNLGGVGPPDGVFSALVTSDEIINAAATYTTANGTYVAFKGTGLSCPSGQQGGDLTAVRVLPGNPPTAIIAWCASQNGLGSPMVTTTDGRSEAIVWSVGAEGDQALHGFNGDTGAPLVSLPVGAVRRYSTPILASGRIFIAGDGRVYAFTP
jgi:hypothetical protein